MNISKILCARSALRIFHSYALHMGTKIYYNINHIYTRKAHASSACSPWLARPNLRGQPPNRLSANPSIAYRRLHKIVTYFRHGRTDNFFIYKYKIHVFLWWWHLAESFFSFIKKHFFSSSTSHIIHNILKYNHLVSLLDLTRRLITFHMHIL